MEAGCEEDRARLIQDVMIRCPGLDVPFSFYVIDEQLAKLRAEQVPQERPSPGLVVLYAEDVLPDYELSPEEVTELEEVIYELDQG